MADKHYDCTGVSTATKICSSAATTGLLLLGVQSTKVQSRQKWCVCMMGNTEGAFQ
jgi:hypothetical protein